MFFGAGISLDTADTIAARCTGFSKVRKFYSDSPDDKAIQYIQGRTTCVDILSANGTTAD